jgi:hypothetical protein
MASEKILKKYDDIIYVIDFRIKSLGILFSHCNNEELMKIEVLGNKSIHSTFHINAMKKILDNIKLFDENLLNQIEIYIPDILKNNEEKCGHEIVLDTSLINNLKVFFEKLKYLLQLRMQEKKISECKNYSPPVRVISPDCEEIEKGICQALAKQIQGGEVGHRSSFNCR